MMERSSPSYTLYPPENSMLLIFNPSRMKKNLVILSFMQTNSISVAAPSKRHPSSCFFSSVAVSNSQLSLKWLFFGGVRTAVPSKQTSLWRSKHDLVSLGVKDRESWRGWVMKRRGMGRRVRMGA